jgi:hypothetical protein
MRIEDMKNKLHAALLVVGSLFTLASSASAQNQNPSKATIPFDFRVGDTTLAAGDYTIEPISVNSRQILELRDSTGKPRAIIQGIRTERREAYSEPHLVFKVYEQGAVLSELWLTTTDSGVTLPKSRFERELLLGSAGKKETVAMVSGK